MRIKLIARILFLIFSLSLVYERSNAQQTLKMSDFAVLAGPDSTGINLIGSSITINGIYGSKKGTVGAFSLVQTTGNVTFNGANIHSKGKVILSNSNIVGGNISAAANYASPSSGTILSVGSSANISGNIDVNGNALIGGGVVSGKVTLRSGFGYTYSGPAPGGGPPVYGTPNLPTFPDPSMFAETTFPSLPPGIPFNITSTQPIDPGHSYGTITFGGNKTLTLNGPGVYVFNKFQWSGNSNKLEFDFKGSSTGYFYIYVNDILDLGKFNATIVNGNSTSAARIYFEVHGNGYTSSSPGNSVIVANGSSGGGSKWFGTVFASKGGIYIGAGTGSSTFSGALLSKKTVTLQSGVTVNYVPFITCFPPDVTAGTDVPKDTTTLNFLGETTLTATSTTTSGVSFRWRAANGGIITNLNDTVLSTIKVSSAGTYIVEAFTTDRSCFSTDSVVVLAAVKNLIGAELLSIYQYSASPEDSFFVVSPGHVMIDIIVKQGFLQEVYTLLTTNTTLYGLDSVISNGASNFIITGRYPIAHLLNLNNLPDKIVYCRPYYQAYGNGGVVTSEGDITTRANLVRSGYGINGKNVKIGVISDSYNRITATSTATLPYQPITQECPVQIQTFNRNNLTQNILQGDLPSSVNVVLDYPGTGTDEGRAMAQIIHDLAPGAQLFFRTGFLTSGDFAKGIKDLKTLYNCDIIVDDVTYPTEPFLKDGVVAKAVDSVKGLGVSYFSSAGNFGRKSYEKNFNAASADTIGFPGLRAHNFGNAAGHPFFQHVKFKPGKYFIVFQWLDSIYSNGQTQGTKYDMDFYTTTQTDGSGLIGFNRDNTGGDPIEFLPITIPGNDACDTVAKDYYILIVNKTGTGDPSRIKYVGFRGDMKIVDYDEGSSTIVGQANALGAIAVGASRFNYFVDTARHYPAHPLMPDFINGIAKANIVVPQMETFSSKGGTWNVQGDSIRRKPDITAADGVNTTVKMGQDYPNNALDGFSNFFGTSAAAPHAAAVAALIIQGRDSFLNRTTPPDTLKMILQKTAIDMEKASNLNASTKFDFISGFGLIDADSAMRSFAAPTPHEIRLVVPGNVIPGDTSFNLFVVGQNFSNNTVIYFNDSIITTEFVSKDTLKANIGEFDGNPQIRAYTEPLTLNHDGEFSNSLYFFSGSIVVQAVGFHKNYGDPMPPVFDTIIMINDSLLQTTTHTLAELGLDNNSLKITTVATATSDVGLYNIDVYRNFGPNAADSALLKKYSYTFIHDTIFVDPIAVKIVPDDKTVIYGHPVGNITYKYYSPNGAQITNPFIVSKLDSTYHEFQPDNVIAVIKDYPGTPPFTDDSLLNISGAVTFQAINNSRKFKVVNGSMVSLDPADSNLFNKQYIVDIAARAIHNYKTASLDDDTLLPTYPGIHSKAVVPASALVKGTAQSGISVSNLVSLVNGDLVPVVNSNAGDLVPIVNNDLMQLVNGATMKKVNNELVPVVNGDLVQVVNGEWMKKVNNDLVPVVNSDLIQLVNGDLVQVVNGELIPLVNNDLIKLVNTVGNVLLQMVNGDLMQLVNNDLVPVVNSELVQVVNGELMQLVNNDLVPVVNNELIKLVNGELMQVVNNELVQMVNGNHIPITNLIQMVNGDLMQVVNNDLVPIVNGELMQVVNNELVPIVNGYSAGTGNNENAAVIIDSDDINVQDGFLGSMFSTSIITGLNIGHQTFTSGMMANSNFKLTYGLGHIDIIEDPACLLTHGEFKNFGPTSVDSTSLWVNMTTKVSGQLKNKGDYILFKGGTITLKSINSNPSSITNRPIPDGKIVADSVAVPFTVFDVPSNTWITKVPINFSSTSDLFCTGVIINSSIGFTKQGNPSTIMKGKFYSNKTFSDQWAYAIAAFQPPASVGPYITPAMIKDSGQVVSINGTIVNGINYKAGAPIPLSSYLVQGGSGGGGNNYTGTKSAYDNFTACAAFDQPTSRPTGNSNLITMEETQTDPLLGSKVLINPNPASNSLTVSFIPLNTGISRMELFTINGAKVLEINCGVSEAGSQYIKNLDVSRLVNGIYLVRVWNAGKATNKKIVIAR